MTSTGKDIILIKKIKEANPQLLLTSEEVLDLLKISQRTFYRWIHKKNNPLPCIFLSERVIRIKWEQLSLWLDGLNND